MKVRKIIASAIAIGLCFGACLNVQAAETAPFSVSDGVFKQSDKDTLSLKYPKGINTYTVWKAEESGDHYCNGVCLAQFKGRIYCQWQSSAVDEDAPDTKVMYSVSSDRGKTWSEPEILADTINNGYVSSGGWLAAKDRLVAYINKWPDSVDPRGGYAFYKVSKDGKNWSDLKPVMMADGKQMNGIIEQDPHVLPSGRIVNAAHFQKGLYVCPIYTDDKSGTKGWRKSVFNAADGGSGTSVEMEPSIFMQKDGTLVMIFRDQKSSFLKLASYSNDNGKSWSDPVKTNVPDARTKQSAGNLSNGNAFMVGCFVDNKLRSPLAIAVSKDGKTFKKAYLLRSSESDPELIYEGKAKRKGFHYVKSLVYGGNLYAGYATNKEAVEVTVIPEGSLAAK